jgi:magnesium-transporting ATPase (P-type)
VALDGGANRTITIDNKQLGLRGSNLANTNWVIGVVVYTGKDSKLMLNYGHSRYKQSRIEKVVNIICVYLVVLQAILCLIMAVSSGFYVSLNAELSSDGVRRKAEYIFFT